MLWYAVVCCGICCGMLWYAVVCCSMLWYAVVCGGMLWYVQKSVTLSQIISEQFFESFIAL